jgi:hypothetical protein
MINRLLIAFISIGFVSTAVQARDSAPDPTREVQIVNLKTNYPAGFDSNIVAFFKDDTHRDIQRVLFRDNQGTKLEYTLDQIRNGVVLLHAMNKDLVRLHSPDFNEATGGTLKLIFYRTFFGGDRRQMFFDFSSPTPGEWKAYTHDEQGVELFDQMKIRIYKKIGVPSGISLISLFSGDTSLREYNPVDLQKADERPKVWSQEDSGIQWF